MHILHSVLLAASWKLPAGHLVHVALLVTLAVVPGAHAVGAVEPVEHDEPTGQSVHSLAAPRPSTLLYVPPLQGSGSAAPAAQYEPEVHVLHAVAP